MEEEYGPEKGERVFYESKNNGTITGVGETKPLRFRPPAPISGLGTSPRRLRGSGSRSVRRYGSSHIPSATCGRAGSAVQCDGIVASSHPRWDLDFRHNWRAMGSGSMLTAAHQEASSP